MASDTAMPSILPPALPPASPHIIRNKYVSRRRGSLAAAMGDDDDMRDELDKLSVAQVELQMELLDAFQTVEVFQTFHDKSDDDAEKKDTDQLEVTVMTNSMRNLMAGLDEDLENSAPQLEVEEESAEMTTRKGFAGGFFKLVEAGMRRDSLNTQRMKQLEIVRSNLKEIEPDLGSLFDSNARKQNRILQDKVKMEEIRRKQRERLMKIKPRTLEQERQRQKAILKLSLDPALVQEIEDEHEIQESLIKTKELEIEKRASDDELELDEVDLNEDTEDVEGQ